MMVGAAAKWGTISDWVASALTLAAIAVGWWQVRKERKLTGRAITAAEQALQLDRDRRADELAQAQRVHVDRVTLDFDPGRHSGRTTLTITNHGQLPIWTVETRWCYPTGIVQFIPKSSSLRPTIQPGESAEFVHQQNGLFVADDELINEIMPTATFVDAMGQHWLKWAIDHRAELATDIEQQMRARWTPPTESAE